MHQLIAQNVESVEQDRQYSGCVVLSQRVFHSSPAALKPLLPISVARDAILMLPKGMKDIAIVEEQPDLLTETVPDRIINAVAPIKLHQGGEERLKQTSLALGC